MKRIVIINCFLYCIASLSAQDFYSNTDTLKTANNTYWVNHLGQNCLVVTNTANNLLGQPQINLDTGNPMFGEDVESFNTSLHLNSECVRSIKQEVFSNSEISTYSKINEDFGYLSLGLAINPTTGNVLEVSFTFLFQSFNSVLLQIPVEKLEALEMEIKDNISFYIPERAKSVSYLYYAAMIFNKDISSGREDRIFTWDDKINEIVWN